MSTVPSNGMLSGGSICGAVREVDVDVEPSTVTGDLDRQVAVRGDGVWKPSMSLGRIGAVRELLDLAPKQPLGVVH